MIIWNSVGIYTGDTDSNLLVDITNDAASEVGGSVSLMNADTENIRLGLDRQFDGAYFDLSSIGIYNDTLKYEYRISTAEGGSSWKTLPIQTKYDFSESGVLQFRIPEDWIKTKLDLYWIRVRVDGSIGSNAMLRQSFPFPAYGYTSVVECERLLQSRLKDGFTESSNPRFSDVERIIRRVEGRINGYTTLSWKPQYIQEELYKYNRYGFVLSRYPVIKFLKLELWTGQLWNELTLGRNDAYFLDTSKGIVKFSYLNTLPFTYSRARTHGYGEYSYPLRASYVWGRDIDFDSRAYMVRDVATKLTVADLLSSYDFTKLVPEGTDRFSIDARIERWTNDAEERLEELRPLRTWL